MKKFIKLAIMLPMFALMIFFANITKTSAQMIDSTLVTNVSQVIPTWLTVDNSTAVYSGGIQTGWQIGAECGSGHNRSGHCCGFSSGGCTKGNSIDIDDDMAGVITWSNVQMYVGTDGTQDFIDFIGLPEDEWVGNGN